MVVINTTPDITTMTMAAGEQVAVEQVGEISVRPGNKTFIDHNNKKHDLDLYLLKPQL